LQKNYLGEILIDKTWLYGLITFTSGKEVIGDCLVKMLNWIEKFNLAFDLKFYAGSILPA